MRAYDLKMLPTMLSRQARTGQAVRFRDGQVECVGTADNARRHRAAVTLKTLDHLAAEQRKVQEARAHPKRPDEEEQEAVA